MRVEAHVCTHGCKCVERPVPIPERMHRCMQVPRHTHRARRAEARKTSIGWRDPPACAEAELEAVADCAQRSAAQPLADEGRAHECARRVHARAQRAPRACACACACAWAHRRAGTRARHQFAAEESGNLGAQPRPGLVIKGWLPQGINGNPQTS